MMAPEDRAAGGAPGGGASRGGGELFELLRRDHREILDLFDRLAQCKTSEMESLLFTFNRIEEEVQRHLEGEERFLYTALERHEEARDVVLESYELHRLITTTVGAFKALALDDERWRPKVRVLRRLVEEHIELTEVALFPAAELVLESGEVRDIMARFLEVKRGDTRRAGLDAPK